MRLDSSLYECTIHHTRTEPKRHAFSHKHFMFHLYLDELEHLSSSLKLLGQKFAPYSFSQDDYIPYEQGTLEDRVRRTARANGCESEIARISLLTNVRSFGYIFNPVSFFFCFDNSSKPVFCLVEVGNTFRESKIFALAPNSDGTFICDRDKLFYVSPFTDLNQVFSFSVKPPGEQLDIAIDTVSRNRTDSQTTNAIDIVTRRSKRVHSQKVVAAHISGSRMPLTDRNLLRLTLTIPLPTLRVITLIHWHALLLWLKRVPYHNKEDNPELQVNAHSRKSVATKVTT